ARFYHPALGRFLTPDSLIPDPLNGQDWNRYTYVRNDPLNLVDPSGHHPVMLRLMAVAFVGVFAPALAEGWAGQTPERSKWWNEHLDCGCTPIADPTLLSIAPGLMPGVAMGVAYGLGGLARDVELDHITSSDAEKANVRALRINAAMVVPSQLIS
ncbi:MAG: RHS repeat-associated core domain-containing protein, partial [Oscillochloris sp.]|nr:RHS repeat-associated core domain-containing protein [Oscillochloris sp.]